VCVCNKKVFQSSILVKFRDFKDGFTYEI